MPNNTERKVKDLMLPIEDYGSVSQEQPLVDAFEILDRTGHRAVMVLDGDKKAVGVLSVREILLGLDLKAKSIDPKNLGNTWFTAETFKDYPVFYDHSEFTGQFKARAAKKVKEVMMPIEVTISEEATLAEAVHVMVNENIGRLAVRASGGEIVGMLRIMEIFNELKKVILTSG